MARLKDSNGGATIGDGEESEVFYVGAGLWHLYLTGTPSTATLTLKCCPDRTGTYTDLVADNVSGTPTTQAFTSTHVTDTTETYHRMYVDNGMYFKFVDDGVGTGTSWQIDVTGPFLHTFT